MRARHLAAALALATTGIAPVALPGSAGAAAGDTPVRAINAYTYGAGHPFQETVCLDGTFLASVATTEASGNTPVSPGTHTVTVLGDNGTSCIGDGLTKDVTIPASSQADIVIWWNPARGVDVAVFNDDPSCVDAGTGRVIGRNVTTHGTSADFTASNTAAGPGLSILGVGSLGSKSVDLAPASFNSGDLTVTGGGPPSATFAPFTVADGTRNTLYAYGGADGDIGAFLVQDKIATCAVVTTTTTTVAPTTTIAATTTTTVAPAAQPVTATPTFTG